MDSKIVIVNNDGNYKVINFLIKKFDKIKYNTK